MRKLFVQLHHWFETIPDSLYPFKQEIEGKWVRGKAAYKQVVERGITLNGPGSLDVTLTVYRGAWHIIGSVAFIIAATTLVHVLNLGDAYIYMLLALATMALCLQEFVLHPRRYNQPLKKGVIDVVTWLTPMAVYILFF